MRCDRADKSCFTPGKLNPTLTLTRSLAPIFPDFTPPCSLFPSCMYSTYIQDCYEATCAWTKSWYHSCTRQTLQLIMPSTTRSNDLLRKTLIMVLTGKGSG